MEPLENPKFSRYFINPNGEDSIFKFYKLAQSSFWVEEEIDSELKKDSIQWLTIDPKIQHLIINQIAFFLIGDGRVNQTISEHICTNITDREVLLWYNFQKMMEDIHNIVYVKLADTYVSGANERRILFNTVENFPIIKNLIDWISKWLDESNDIHKLNDDTIQDLNDLKIFYTDCHKLVSIFNPTLSTKFTNLFNKLNKPKPALA